jgi:hypothetical protein
MKADAIPGYLWGGISLRRWGYFLRKEIRGKMALTDTEIRRANSDGRKMLATGVDPMARRRAEKTAARVTNENSFASAAASWLEHWQEGKSPRHVDYVRRRIAADILPALGERPIVDFEAPDLVAMIKAIAGRAARGISPNER